MLLKKDLIHVVFITILLILGGFLRISNLAYSELQDDEKKAILRIKDDQNLYDFFMQQRKGPMQFIVTSTMLAFNPDTRNELLLRVPFTMMNILSIALFYLIAYKITKSTFVSFLGSLLYLSNGLVIGFGRIAQYQNINLLFSFLALYSFIWLGEERDKKYRIKIKDFDLKLGVFGTFFWCISFLAHWDAVFFLIPLTYYFINFLYRKDINKQLKQHIVKNMLIMGSIVLIYLIPYIYNQYINSANIEYFNKRVGLSTYEWIRHKFIFELYNPFVYVYLLIGLAVFAIFKIKDKWIYILWFIVNLLTIKYLMQKPGTHIYNYVIPITFLATIGLNVLYKFKWLFYSLILIPTLILTSYCYYQSYMLFVDHKFEYPWQEKTLLNLNINNKYINKTINFKTEIYKDKEILTFGFPHFRNWKEINKFVMRDNNDCKYITNEGKEISQIYMDSSYGLTNNMNCYYIVDIKRPFNIRGNGIVFAKAIGKEPIYTYRRNGETLVKVYKVLGNKF